MFDQYGNYSTRTTVGEALGITITEDFVVYNDATHLHLLERSLVSEEKIELPMKAESAVVQSGKRFYFISNGSLVVCEFAR